MRMRSAYWLLANGNWRSRPRRRAPPPDQRAQRHDPVALDQLEREIAGSGGVSIDRGERRRGDIRRCPRAAPAGSYRKMSSMSPPGHDGGPADRRAPAAAAAARSRRQAARRRRRRRRGRSGRACWESGRAGASVRAADAGGIARLDDRVARRADREGVARQSEGEALDVAGEQRPRLDARAWRGWRGHCRSRP